MKKKFAFVFLVFSASLILTLNGCKQATECGNWRFIGIAGNDNYEVINTFTFTPANCGSDCTVNQDAIVQMVWVYDDADHTNIFASDQTTARARASSKGWVIDKIDGYAYGFYGLNNDGTFDPGFNNTGNNSTPTVLNDNPGGWGANTLFFAVDVAVAYSSNSCQNRILGSYFWSWGVDKNGIAITGPDAPGWTGLDQEFQDAVTGWNTWAPTSGPELQGGIPLPHAVDLPQMQDL